MIYSPYSGGDKERIRCEDGSFTLYSRRFDEPYHSTRDGALQESLQKYVLPALTLKQEKETLVILDICFGLGYNSFATIAHILEQGLSTRVQILAPEFDEALLRSLDTFSYPEMFAPLGHMIEAISRDLYYEDAQFRIEILLGDARESMRGLTSDDLLQSNESSAGLTPKRLTSDDLLQSNESSAGLTPETRIPKIDIIYQDAFSPAHNPLLWTREWFAQLRSLCRDDAVLFSYSTAAAVRLGLYENGFHLFVHRAEKIRYSTVASLQMLEGFEYIDMELKKRRNPSARSLKDADFLK